MAAVAAVGLLLLLPVAFALRAPRLENRLP